MTTTIYSINADYQERYDTVRSEMIAKTIKLLQRKGYLNIKVIPTHPVTVHPN